MKKHITFIISCIIALTVVGCAVTIIQSKQKEKSTELKPTLKIEKK